MLRFFVPAGLLAMLAGCATSGPVAAPPAQARTETPAVVTGQQGTILAVRPIPASVLIPVRLGWPGAERQRSGTEFIVRLDDGSTLAVVQPGAADLHAGQRVRIRAGAPARLLALSDKVALR